MRTDTSDELHLDNELAQLTDALFSGERVSPPDATLIQTLHDIATQLYQLIDPQTPPPADYRLRLQKQLNEEWYRRQSQPSAIFLPSRRRVQLAGVAAVIVLLFVAVLVFWEGNSSADENELSGTATTFSIEAVAVLGLLLTVITLFILWKRRR